MAKGNILVNGKNNITARANFLADVQNNFANRTTAANVNATPNLPTRPTVNSTNLNLVKAQQPVQTTTPVQNKAITNLNTKIVQPVQTNTTAGGVGTVAPVQQQSRFIGLQKQPTGNSVSNITKSALYIPTAGGTAGKENKKEEKRFRTSEQALLDFQADVLKNKGKMKDADIKRLYPEFADQLDVMKELQAELRPIVKNGQGVDGEQLAQYYPELIQPKNLKDVEAIRKQSEKDNQKLQSNIQKVEKVVTENFDVLSPEGQKYVQDYLTLAGVVDSLKKNYRIVGGANDDEILQYAIENNPQLKSVADELQNLHLSELDKATIDGNSQSIITSMISGLQHMVRSANTKVQNFAVEQNNLAAMNGETGQNVFNTTWNTAANILGAADQATTAGARFFGNQNVNYNVGDKEAQEAVEKQQISDLLAMGGGYWKTIWGIATAPFEYGKLNPITQPVVEGVVEPVFEGISELEKTVTNPVWNKLGFDKEDKENADAILLGEIFREFKTVKQDVKIRTDAAKDIVSDAFNRTVKSNKRSEMKEEFQKAGVYNEAGYIKPEARTQAAKIIAREFAKDFTENFKNDAKQWGDVVDFYREKEGVKSYKEQINDLKQGAKDVIDTAKETGKNVGKKIETGIEKGFNKMDESIGRGIDNLRNKVTKEKTTEIKAEEKAGRSQPKKGVVGKVAEGVSKVGTKIYDKTVEPVATKVAEGITSTTAPQDKLFKALNPSINVLSRKKGNYDTMRQSADRANELIVEYGDTPTNSTDYYNSIVSTKKKVWNNGIQQGLDEYKYTTIDAKDLINPVREALKEFTAEPLEALKGDVKKLEAELQAIESKGIISLLEMETKKRQINAILEYGLPPDASQIYEKGMRELNRQIGIQEDRMISELPGEFSKFKRDYGALTAIEEDAQKLMIKDMKKKLGGNLIQNWSRIEGLTKLGKKGSFLEGAAQIILGESLGKVKDTNFLIKSGFEGLRGQYKGGTTKPEGVKIKKKPPTPKLEDKRTDIEKGKIAELDRRSEKNKEEGYKTKNAVTSEKSKVTEKKAEPKAEKKETPKAEKELETRVETKKPEPKQEPKKETKGKEKFELSEKWWENKDMLSDERALEIQKEISANDDTDPIKRVGYYITIDGNEVVDINMKRHEYPFGTVANIGLRSLLPNVLKGSTVGIVNIGTGKTVWKGTWDGKELTTIKSEAKPQEQPKNKVTAKNTVVTEENLDELLDGSGIDRTRNANIINNIKSFDDLKNLLKPAKAGAVSDWEYEGELNGVKTRVRNYGDTIFVKYGDGQGPAQARIDMGDKDHIDQLKELLSEINNDGEILESNRSNPFSTNTAVTAKKNAVTAIKNIDNSSITGKFRNLTLNDYKEMQKLQGVEEQLVNGDREGYIANKIKEEILSNEEPVLFPGAEIIEEELYPVDYEDFRKFVEEKDRIEKETQRLMKANGENLSQEIEDLRYNFDNEMLPSLGIYGVDDAYIAARKIEQIMGEADAQFKKDSEAIKPLVNKYGRYWNQGKQLSQATKDALNKQDLERQLGENETPQNTEGFMRDAEENQDLISNETPQRDDVENLVTDKAKITTKSEPVDTGKIKRQTGDSRAANFTNTIMDIIESNGGLKDGYLKVKKEPYEPLYIEEIGGGKVAIGQTYIQEGDVMFDPEIVFGVDENGKLQAETYRNDGLGVYDKPIQPNAPFLETREENLRPFIKEGKSVAKSGNGNIIGKNNSLTTNKPTNEQQKLGGDNQGLSKGVLGGSRPLSMNEGTNGEQLKDTGGVIQDLHKEQLDNDAISKGYAAGPAIGQQQPRQLTKNEARAVNQNAKDILAKHEFSTNPKDYTKEEIDILRQYEGAGGLTKYGEDTTGALDQFYTPQAAIDAVWHLVDKYKDSKDTYDVLEPTVGTGRFLRDAKNEKYEGHEIDKTPGTIAQILHPNADIHVGDFENQFMDFTGRRVQDYGRRSDIVVGNPPYSQRKTPQQKAGLEPNIKRSEEFFIKKGVDILNQGGMLAMVVPSTFLTNPMDYAKEEILKQASLVDAYRLPEGIFPYTQVGTDIIVLKKNKDGSDLISDNKWFEEHPEKVLGEVKERVNRFGKLEKYVDGGSNPQSRLNAIYEDAKAIEPTPVQQAESYSPTEAIETTPVKQKTTTEVTGTTKNKVTATTKAPVKRTVKPGTKIEKQTIIVGEKTDLVDTIFGDGDLDSRLLDYAKKTDINGYVQGPALELVEKDPKNLNFYKYHAVTNDLYFSGDIFEKLDTLEREKADLSEAQYKKQKDGLLAVLPEQYTIENHPFVSPLDEDVMALENADKETVKQMFLQWFRENVSYDTMNKRMAQEYVNGDPMRSSNANTWGMSDKEKDRVLRHEKSVVMEQTNEKFNEWLWTRLDKKMQQTIVDKFNKENRSYVLPRYDKMPLPLKGISDTFMGDKFTPKEAQIEATNFLLSKGAGIAALGVGRGKTIVGTMATREAQLRGRNKRPLIVAPSPTLYAQWVRTIREQYPDWEIVNLGKLNVDDIKRLKRDLGDDPKDWIKDGQVAVVSREGLANNIEFKPKTKAELQAKLKDVMEDKSETAKKTARAEESLKKKIEEWLAPGEGKGDKHVYYENAEFLRTMYNDMLDMEKSDFLERFKEHAKQEYKDLPDNVIEADAEALWKNRPIFIEDLGIDHLTVDEMHNFKNVFTSANMQQKDGSQQVNRYGGIIKGKSSNRGQKLYLASQYVMDRNGNRNVFGLTATPFNNQPIEIYNMLSMVGKNELEKMGLKNINDFFSKFAEFKEGLTPNAAGTELEYKFVMKDFANKRDLQRLITKFILFKGDAADLVRPEYRLRTPVLEMSPLQKQMQTELEYKALDNTEKGDVLSATNGMIGNLITPFMVKGCRAPTGWQDFIDNSAKLKFIAQSIKNLRDTGNQDGVFIYMPKGVEFHETFREALSHITGTPKEKIGIINTKTDAKKDDIAEAFRNGKINILIGGKNTAEGIDLQDNGYMTFITDVGRNTTERTQVDGRVWRQGNLNSHVLSVVPLMKDSADIIYMGKADQKGSRINNALDMILYGGEGDLSPEEAMTNLMTDPGKKAKSMINIEKQGIDKDIYGVRTQRDRLVRIKNNIEAAQGDIAALEKKIETEKQVGRTWNIQSLKSQIKEIEKAQNYLEKYLETNGSVPEIEDINKNIEKLDAEIKALEEKKEEYDKADENGILDNMIKGIQEEYKKNSASIKDYDAYLEDLKADYNEVKKLGSKKELKEFLENRKNVLSNDKNKVTTQAARTSRPSIRMNVEEWEEKNSKNVVVNPDGKQVPTNNESKNGKKVVVDSKGKAYSFYHGTPNGGFEEFDMNSRGSANDLSSFGDFGKGFYFTPDRQEAINYATLNNKVEGKNPEVYEVKLYMNNPLDFRKYYDGKREIEAVYRKSVNRNGNYLGGLNEEEQAELDKVLNKYGFKDEEERDDFADLIDSLGDNRGDWDMAAHGYDGVIGVNGHGEERVVFDKNQIEIIKHEKQQLKNGATSNDKNRVTNNAARAYSPTIVMRLDENGNPIKKNKVTSKKPVSSSSSRFSPELVEKIDKIADSKGIKGNTLKKMKVLNKTVDKGKGYQTETEKEIYNLKKQIIIEYIESKGDDILDQGYGKTSIEIRQGKTRVNWHIVGKLYKELKKQGIIKKRR